MNRVLCRCVFAVLLLAVLPWALHAQQQGPNNFSQTADGWRRSLDQVQAALGISEASREALDRLGLRVDEVRKAAERARADADAQRKPLADQLAALGPAPAKDQPAEPSEVARQRRQLIDEIARYDARMKQAELTIARAGGLQRDLARIANEQIAQRLLARGQPPLALNTLSAATRQLVGVPTILASALADWWSSRPFGELEPVNLALLAAVALAALIAGWPLRNWLLRRYGRLPHIAEPSYARRVLAAGIESLSRGLLPAIGLLAVAQVLVEGDFVTGLVAGLVQGALLGGICFSLISAFTRAALSPEAPSWRIVPFGADASRVLSHRVTVLAAVAAIFFAVDWATRPLHVDARELFDLYRFLFDTVIGAVTLTLVQRRLWQSDGVEAIPAAKPGGTRRAGWSGPMLRLLVGVALVAAPILALFGYPNLASHIVSRVLASGVLAGALLLLRTLVREVVALLVLPESPRSARLRRALALSDSGSRILNFWLGALLDLLLILPGAVLALWLWGVPSSAIGLWAGNALHGFDLGKLRVSLTDIVLAILVFAGFWTATRLVQRLLSEKLLPQTRLDAGVRHSLSAVVGYIGFVVAAAFAISTLGLSLANLAIIAGALSVGIGFGLQNIVNNFVSGLILLIERPIKVGDWVVVGQHQGYVARISVRATEIETFERASVIMPNSELLSGAVVNWTHRDRYGRVDVKVGVAYGSDIERVRELLLTCARQHRQILSWPAATVLFRNFGDSALEFELRGFIADVEQRLSVASDLHFAIDKAFRAAGIAMPFPQRDLTLRNLDELARALSGLGGDRPPPARDGNSSADENAAPIPRA